MHPKPAPQAGGCSLRVRKTSQTKGVAHFGRPSAAAPRCTFPPPFTSFYDDSWKIGRPGYSASMLCGVDPPNYQVDTYWLTSGGRFYADLEWLYVVTAEVVDRKWTWSVEVRVPRPAFWDEPTFANTRVRHRLRTIEAMARHLGI